MADLPNTSFTTNPLLKNTTDPFATPNIQTTPPTSSSSEPAMISTTQGKAIVDTATQKLNDLKGTTATTPATTTPVTTPTTPAPTTPTPPAPTDITAKDSVTYINPDTGAEKTLTGPAINDKALADLKTQGYVESNATLSSLTKDKLAAETAKKAAQDSLDSLVKDLSSTVISAPELQSSIQRIQGVYQARIAAMENINQRREATLNTLGIRLGSRYTGGSAGTMGSILSEEERQGQTRIMSIQSEMLNAIAGAEKAAKEQNYSVYTKMVDLATKKNDDKIKAFADLEKAQKAEQDKIEQEAKNVDQQSSILEQIHLGTKDPVEIFTALGGKVSFDDIKTITDTLPKKEAFTLSEGQTRYDENGNVIAHVAKTYAPKAGDGSMVTSPTAVLSDFPPDIQNAAQSILDGKSKLNEYPSAKRLSINSAMSLVYKAEGGDTLAQGAYDAIKELETHPGFSGAVGTNYLGGFGKSIPGSDSAGFLAKLDQLKANIKLVNIKYLKGTGALSDSEGKTLEDAGTSLNPDLPEADFTKELARVKKVLEKTSNVKPEVTTDYSNSSNADLLGIKDKNTDSTDPNGIYK